jgi:hypothetical protein
LVESLAKPDGYTIDLGQLNTHVINGAFYSLRYHLLNDFEPISPIVKAPVILYASALSAVVTRLRHHRYEKLL